MKNVAVFFGGQSVEHDVSVITGALTTNSIDKNLYNAVPVYVDKDGIWYTGEILKDVDEYKNLDYKKLTEVAFRTGSNVLYKIKGKKIKPLYSISVAINCMHGERGEDGCLAGILKSLNIPLASPDITASSVCMDKSFTKTVMKGLRIKTLPSVTVKNKLDQKEIFSKLKLPLLVKPNSLGSSIGLTRVDDKEELASAVALAKRFGEQVIIEPCLRNFIEINCAAYRNENDQIIVSECERPVGKDGILSFDDKYKSGKRIFPADIDKDISDNIKKTTKKVYAELNAEGVIRIDYFVCGSEVYLNEVNTVPGSLAFYLFGDTLKSFTELLNELLRVAIKRGNERATVQKTFSTGILNMGGIKSKNACKKR